MSDLPLSTSPDKGAEAPEKALKNIHKPRKTDKIDRFLFMKRRFMDLADLPFT